MFEVFRGYFRGILRWVWALLAVFFSLLGCIGAASAAEPTPVTTRALDTGQLREGHHSIPIPSGEPSPTNVYMLKVPVIHNEEVLRATGDVEISANRTQRQDIKPASTGCNG